VIKKRAATVGLLCCRALQNIRDKYLKGVLK